jgi:hypothetical protein
VATADQLRPLGDVPEIRLLGFDVVGWSKTAAGVLEAAMATTAMAATPRTKLRMDMREISK